MQDERVVRGDRDGERKRDESMKKIKSLFILYIICLCICFLGLMGCAKKPVPKKPIKISINVWPGYAYAFLAQEKGFFKKNNVDVQLILKQSTPESLELFTNGEVEGCFDILGDIIMMRAKGIPGKIVCVVDYSDTGDVIIGRSEIKSLAGLKGKTISFEGINTFSHIFVITALEKAGLSESDVRFKNISAHDVLAGLDEKKIDAGHTWEPTKSQALKKGYKIFAKAGDFPGLITDVLVFTPTIIKERPDEIRAIIKALFEARDYLKNNRDEAVTIMADKMGMSKEEMTAGLNGLHQLSLKENLEFLTSPVLSYISVKMIIDFYLKRGQLSRNIETNEVVEPRFIKELTNQ